MLGVAHGHQALDMVMSEPSGSDDEPECTDDEDDKET